MTYPWYGNKADALIFTIIIMLMDVFWEPLTLPYSIHVYMGQSIQEWSK